MEPTPERIRVTIFENGTNSHGKAIFLSKNEEWKDFLSRCGNRLQIKAQRVFNDQGAEIDDLHLIFPNDVLHISEGESFLIPSAQDNEWITLNVGGKIFCTTRSTLMKHPDSMLSRMFSKDWSSRRDIHGAYLIDRNPEYFSAILNFLRCDQLIIDDGLNPQGLLEEALFFNITALLDPLNLLVQKQNKKTNTLTRKELISILLTSSVNSSLRCQGLDFSDQDLSKLDLSHINFKMTNFTRANLEKTNLDHAQLQEATLQEANLQKASLRGANLGGANLEGANLKSANFEDRGGIKANLEGAKLKGAHLEDCNFSGANLRAANLRGCNLENANLRRADLAGADLEGVNLRGANLNKANLIGANLANANFDIRTTTPWG